MDDTDNVTKPLVLQGSEVNSSGHASQINCPWLVVVHKILHNVNTTVIITTSDPKWLAMIEFTKEPGSDKHR